MGMRDLRGAENIPSMFHVLPSAAAQDESGPMVVSTKRRPVLKDENRYDLFVKAISGSIAQAEPYLTQTQRMKRVGQVWKQLSIDERLKIIQEQKVKMEAMGVKDRALVDSGPMIQVRGLKRRAKERYLFSFPHSTHERAQVQACHMWVAGCCESVAYCGMPWLGLTAA